MMRKILAMIICGGLMINALTPVDWVLATSKESIKDEVGLDYDEEASDDEEVLNDDEALPDLPAFFVKAINPGYKIDGINNVGEMIEIARINNSDTPISLAGLAVGYTNSSGNDSLLVEFPEYSWMTGESILLRLASSPEAELANLSYNKTMAMNAKIELILNGEIIDEVCWTGKSGCAKPFSSANPTTLVRNLETGEFEHVFDYQPNFASSSYHAEVVEENETAQEKTQVPRCRSLQFSEILSYYETAQSEQFIELYNHGVKTVNMDGCQIRYKNKSFALSGSVAPEGYYVYHPTGFKLTKNPVNSNQLEIIDVDGVVVDKLIYPNGQRKGTAFAWLGYDKAGNEIWKVTYAPTPGEPNNYQEFKTCEVGKVINKVTGNCVKVTSVKEKVCKTGYYLNILTGRCRKIVTKEEKTCKEGYYLNPETNRCRKIKANNGADYNLEPEQYQEESSFVALYAVLGILGAGGIYLIYEFRKEIAKFWWRLWRRKKD